MNPIYLDNNATTPIDKEVADAMRPFLDDYFGNPSSLHAYGVKTKLAVEKSRMQIAGLLNCDPSEIVFTSGGTESNNYAIKGIAFEHQDKGNHIITSSVEHPSVFEVCKYLEKSGFEITYLPVDEFGLVDPEEVKRAIRDETILISVMHANNEVGTIQPIEEIAVIARKHYVFFHTDAAQSLGKIKVDVKELGVDLLSVAGHKLYAPKGIGVLFIRNGIKLEKLIHGADHEQNLRAGTENVLEIVGLGKACEIANQNLEKNAASYQKTRDYLFELLKEALPRIKLNGHLEKRLPNTLSISFPRIEANTLISRLDGVAASAGAACHAESIDVSAVLEAMQVPLDYAMGTIRFSTGRCNTMADIKTAAGEIIDTVKTLMPRDGEQINYKTADTKEVKLTHYTHGLGCACKIHPKNLEKILQSLPSFFDPMLLVGTETSDDATVYRITDEIALVQTLDFFTPIVDDPYEFGAIAATNALSDIYAMGAKPLFALNIVAFPEGTLSMDVLKQILKGAHDKAKEAGIGVFGGHTIEDPEPKYGMVVSGSVHPDKVIRNKGAKEGDLLVLTKPLGTGIISTAIKRGLVEENLKKEVTALMCQLNKTAAEFMLNYEIHACTDVTGYGLMGHLREMSKASRCDVNIVFDKVPFIREAKALAISGIIPGGTFNNLDCVRDDVDFGTLTRTNQLLLCDAQTSGGLLVALNPEQAAAYLNDLNQAGLTARIIGEFTNMGEGRISIL
jgi:cysteine desulfurase